VMYSSYVVPEGYYIPFPIDAKPGDVIVLRPSHPTAPLSVIRHVRHGIFPAILDHLDCLECVEVSVGARPEEVLAQLRRVSGQFDPQCPALLPLPGHPALQLLE
jgi:hypothetical protein